MVAAAERVPVVVKMRTGGGGGGGMRTGGGGGGVYAGGGNRGYGGGVQAGGGQYHAPTFSQPHTGGYGGGYGAGFGGARVDGGYGGYGGARFSGGTAGGRVAGTGERVVGGGAAAAGGGAFAGGDRAAFVNRSGNSFNNVNVNRQAYYGNWYHGGWAGHAGWNGAGYRPWGWGWGGGGPGWGWGGGWGWGLGAGLATAGLVAYASPWNWGYYGYNNPYYAGGGGSYFSYAQPIVAAPLYPDQTLVADDGGVPGPDAAGLADNSAGPNMPPEQQQAMQIFAGAREQFTAGDYAGALSAINNAIQIDANDPVMHEFRALCLFAQGNYRDAAAAMYAVLSGGPGWDWTTEAGLYPSIAIYTKQLRALEQYSRENPQAADARFLLAYQYMLTGHNDAAGAELKQVVALQPNDTLASQLLKLIGGPTDDSPPSGPLPGSAPGTSPVTSPAAPPAGKPVDASTLVGNWTATRPDGSKVQMDLTSGKKFSWRFDQDGKPQEMKGDYSLADNYLVLKASEQNALVGQVGLVGNNQMSFRLADNNPADPGLVFKR